MWRLEVQLSIVLVLIPELLCEKIVSPEMEYETSDLWNERFDTIMTTLSKEINYI